MCILDAESLNLHFYMIPLFRFSSAVFPVNCRERDGQLREEGRAQVRGGEPPQLQGERAWALIGRLLTLVRWYEQDN